MKKIVGVFLVLVAASYAAFAEQAPAASRGEADYKVGAAQQLIENAKLAVQQNQDGQGVKKAVEMLVQAGQYFEQAAQTYQSLGAQYASPEDVQNAYQGMQFCIESIKQLTGQTVNAPAAGNPAKR